MYLQQYGMQIRIEKDFMAIIRIDLMLYIYVCGI